MTLAAISDLATFEPKVFCDERGFFFDSFSDETFGRATNLALVFGQALPLQLAKDVLRDRQGA